MPIDYASLAKQNGAVDKPIDYAALASQNGGGPGKSDEKTVGGFLGNVVSSTGKLVGDTVSAVAHPVDTLRAIGSIPVGVVEKVAGPLPIEGGGRSAAQLDALIDHFKQRYGSLENAKNTLYKDPAGVVADVSSMFGAAGVASDAAGLTRAAKIAESVSSAVDPLANVARAGKVAVSGAAKAADATGIAERMYQSSLKPPPGSSKVNSSAVNQMVKTGLDEQIPVTRGGLERLQSLVDDVNSQIKAKIDPSVGIDPQAVAARVADTRSKFANQVNPTADLAAIDATKQEFLGTHGDAPIPADKAQALKQGTYQQLRGKYGQLSGAQIETEKALARGLKEELATAFPELGSLNARDSRLIQLESALDRAVKRIGNRESLPIGDVSLAALKAVIDSPTIKSHLAIALDGATKKSIGAASAVGAKPRMATVLGRIEDYFNSLSQSQSSVQAAPSPAQ